MKDQQTFEKPDRITGRRSFLKSVAAAGAGVLVGMTNWPARLLSEFTRKKRLVPCIEGDRWLRMVDDEPGVFSQAAAQWGPVVAPRFQWVCDYFGQCGWLDTWNPGHMQLYWSNMAAQYAWLTAQHQAAIMRAAEFWAMRRFQISFPFVMPAVQSVYCVARGPQMLLFGVSRYTEEVVVQGLAFPLVNVVLDIMGRRSGHEAAQRCGAPQSSSRPALTKLGTWDVPVNEYSTFEGKAQITDSTFKDVITGEVGHLAIWDNGSQKERTLVPV